MRTRSVDGTWNAISVSDDRMATSIPSKCCLFKFQNILKNNGPEKREQTRIKSYVCQILYTGFDWLSIIYFSVWEKSTLSDWQTSVSLIIFLDDSYPTLVWPWNDLWPIFVPLYAINWQSWIFVKMETQF